MIELLVVIGIISLLVAILLPSLERAKALARSVVCLGNSHQLSLAFLMYFDEWHYLPTNWRTRPGYPGSEVNLNFFGVEAWACVPTRPHLALTWPYHQSPQIAHCPDCLTDPKLAAAGKIYPGAEKDLSYGTNALTLNIYRTTNGGWGDWLQHGVPGPERFGDPGATLWFMDSGSGYLGAYVLPPTWELIYRTWPDAPSTWYETFAPSNRHMDGFNAGFLDGHGEWCSFAKYYVVGPSSPSAVYWGEFD